METLLHTHTQTHTHIHKYIRESVSHFLMQIFCLFVRLWGDLSETRIYNNIFSCKCACVIVWQLPLGVAPPTRCCQLFCTLSLLYFRLLSDWITRPDDKRWNNIRGPFTTGIVANERQSLWQKYKSNACQTQEINFYHLFRDKEDAGNLVSLWESNLKFASIH